MLSRAASYTSPFESLFRDFLNPSFFAPASAAPAYPLFNAWEEDQRYVAEAELPGVKLEDLEITISGRELSIKGSRRDSAQPDAAYHRKERAALEFTRNLRFPTELNAAGAEATLQNGILTITLPKSAQNAPHKLTIKPA